MTPGVSWNERGLSPELFEAAREAARRAGMSVDDWLNSTFGDAPRGKPASAGGAGRDELVQRMGRLSAGEH